MWSTWKLALRQTGGRTRRPPENASKGDDCMTRMECVVGSVVFTQGVELVSRGKVLRSNCAVTLLHVKSRGQFNE